MAEKHHDRKAPVRRRFSNLKKRDIMSGGRSSLTATALSGLLPVKAQVPAPGSNPRPGFDNRIPDKILTPDMEQPRTGTLNFVNGVPTAVTTRKVYDHRDFLRGVETFLNSIPAASIKSRRMDSAEQGATASHAPQIA